jgi:hypothetical protein
MCCSNQRPEESSKANEGRHHADSDRTAEWKRQDARVHQPTTRVSSSPQTPGSHMMSPDLVHASPHPEVSSSLNNSLRTKESQEQHRIRMVENREKKTRPVLAHASPHAEVSTSLIKSLRTMESQEQHRIRMVKNREKKEILSSRVQQQQMLVEKMLTSHKKEAVSQQVKIKMDI